MRIPLILTALFICTTQAFALVTGQISQDKSHATVTLTNDQSAADGSHLYGNLNLPISAGQVPGTLVKHYSSPDNSIQINCVETAVTDSVNDSCAVTLKLGNVCHFIGNSAHSFACLIRDSVIKQNFLDMFSNDGSSYIVDVLSNGSGGELKIEGSTFGASLGFYRGQSN